MGATCFPFAMGAFRCASLRDGAFNYPPQSICATPPKAELDEVLSSHGLPTGRHKLLVDAGAGGLGAMAPKVFPGIDHTTTVTGQLVESLHQFGVQPTDIDAVIMWHAHPDHIGGMLDSTGHPRLRQCALPDRRRRMGVLDRARCTYSDKSALRPDRPSCSRPGARSA